MEIDQRLFRRVKVVHQIGMDVLVAAKQLDVEPFWLPRHLPVVKIVISLQRRVVIDTGLAGWRRADTEQGAERLRILDRIDDTARPFRTRQQRARADREFVDRLPVEMNVERSEEHTSELQSLKRLSYAVFC